MQSEPSAINSDEAPKAGTAFWDLPLFLGQVALIAIGTAILMAIAASLPLALAKASSGFAAWLHAYDPNGLSIVILALAPLLLGWWFYTRALRRVASRLDLDIPRSQLGIPLLGELRFVAELARRASRRW